MDGIDVSVCGNFDFLSLNPTDEINTKKLYERLRKQLTDVQIIANAVDENYERRLENINKMLALLVAKPDGESE